MYKHPGVYIEHVPSGVLAIEAASTSIACFIGPVKRGPVNEPVFITSRSQFAAEFGELDDATGGIRDDDATGAPDYFGHAVNLFYDNGGSQAYVMRLAEDTAMPAKGGLQDPVDGTRGLFLTAKNPGEWANDLIAELAQTDAGDASLGHTLALGYEVPRGSDMEFVVLESFSGLQMDPNDGAFVDAVVNAGSKLVSCKREVIGGDPAFNSVSALRSASLFDFDIDEVKNKLLTMTVNGQPLEVKFETDLTDIRVKYDDGTGETTETHTLGAAMTDLKSLADGMQEAVNAHSKMDGFRAYASANAELHLIPPTVGAGPNTLTVDGGGARAPLGLEAADVTALDYPAAGRAVFFDGADATDVGKAEYAAAFQKLRDVRNISIIVLPGKVWDKQDGGTDFEAIDLALTHAEFMKNRVVIVDPKNPVQDPALTAVAPVPLNSAGDVVARGYMPSTFSALYYPWLNVNNPHYDADTKANRPIIHHIPPSGMAAGMWARIDGSRGVWKAPAGLEASVRGAQGPNLLIGNDIQDQLNEWGVNCIRAIIGPPVIWGARTLATKVKPDQRYVPVRRTSAMIGESLYNALQAVVFEPNKHTLWASLRASANDFMDQLFRAGAFQGEKASQAYYVKCGLGQTMTQADIDAGIVRLVVGYAPLKPAEFVVVQIKQIVGQTG